MSPSLRWRVEVWIDEVMDEKSEEHMRDSWDDCTVVIDQGVGANDYDGHNFQVRCGSTGAVLARWNAWDDYAVAVLPDRVHVQGELLSDPERPSGSLRLFPAPNSQQVTP